MAENSKIEWTDHTLNFWWGCLKVSPGCEHCYAETLSKRVGRNIWGPPQTTERWRTKGPWRDALKWDRAAEAEGKRKRVFCQSMSDFFEDHPQLDGWRQEAFGILKNLKWLDVQLLTKRPENVMQMVPFHWREDWPDHIQIGTSVENQETANKRIPEILKIPTKIRFLSVEPMIGPVDLLRDSVTRSRYGIHWIIIGGESGAKARPFNLRWANDLLAFCSMNGIAAFVKQLGCRPYADQNKYGEKHWLAVTGKGDNINEWPEWLRVREFPT